MTLRILLVEENLSERDRLATVLQDAGYRVESVENVSGARAVLRRSSIDLSVVFASKDNAIDLGLLEWLRSRDSSINMPILVVAEDITTKARLAAFRAGANDYVARPFELRYFLNRISNLLAHRESRPSVIPLGVSRRILVVDDSPTYGYALSAELKKDGHDVAYADTGHDALSYIDSQKADLVILDVFLPDLNGVEVCRRIKAAERTVSLPVLVLTGREKSAVRADAAAANADEFAVKSTDLESICAKVRTLLVRPTNRRISTSRLAAVSADSSGQQHRASFGRMRVGEAPEPAMVQRTSSASRLSAVAVEPNAPQSSSDRMRVAAVVDPNVAVPSRSRLSAKHLSNVFNDSGELFESIVRLTGLSELLARSTVESVCRRLDLNAHALQPRDLPNVLEGLERALQLFLPAGEARQRLAALNALVR